MRRIGVGLAAISLASALAGCGQYEWPNRAVVVAPRSFAVHEENLLTVDGTPKTPCPVPEVNLRVADSCTDVCGPILVSRGDTQLGTLLGTEFRRASTVDPDRIERPYAKSPQDDSLRALAVPSDGTPLTIKSGCMITGRTGDGPWSFPPSNNMKTINIKPGLTCGATVWIECRS